MKFWLLKAFHRKVFDVDITYHYGRLSQDLQTVKLVYLRNNTRVQKVVFDYLNNKTTGQQSHRIQPPRGDYTVIIELLYAGLKSHSTADLKSNHPEIEKLRLHRSFSIQQDTTITFYLDKDNPS